jgi:murein L,D-transpeptidase YcbB/YkuD
MRGRSLVAILGATGACVLAAAGVVWFAAGQQPETAATAVIVDIPDNPATLAATKAQEAEVVVSLPSTIPAPVAEEARAPEPAPPEKLLIVDTIRLKLNDAALRAGAHADDLAALEAFYAGHTGPALWITNAGFSPEAQIILGEIAKANEWGLDASAFVVPPADYQPTLAEDQAAAEIALSLAILKYARYARGGRANPSALSKVVDQTPSLRNPGTVLAEIAAAQAPDAYLRDLHPKHEQFERLRQALLKARADGSTKPQEANKILINMERWRWMPEGLGSLYVWLNAPEFMMYVVKGGKTIHSEKIVVGKPVYATPVFSADMKTIVFNPEWTVPPTIVREDLLPKLRGGGGWFGGGNTAILKQHKLKVLYNGREVDPGKIDWNNVNLSAISFTQAPGPTNVLGKVKFLYPNKHIVYMHDTIKRDLLQKEVRAEGHHCPRVDNPGKVAAILLAEDKGWDKSKIDQLMDKGNNSAVTLDRPIPVHMTYFTAVVDKDGKVKTFADVYKLDGAVVSAIIGREAAPPEAVAGTAPVPPRKPADGGNIAASTP